MSGYNELISLKRILRSSFVINDISPFENEILSVSPVEILNPLEFAQSIDFVSISRPFSVIYAAFEGLLNKRPGAARKP